ncbi:MAG: DNA topology modulation protein [bacterium]
MRKVLVIGSGGAGKSTFARRLGALLELEVIHLDSLYWSAGWVEMPKAEWQRAVEELLGHQAWIIDGNYSGTLQIRLEACDTVIFLDVSRLICLGRLAKRAVLYRDEHRPDMADGCPEKLNWEFIRWAWGYPERTRPKIVELLEKNAENKQVIRLRSRAEVERFFARWTVW